MKLPRFSARGTRCGPIIAGTGVMLVVLKPNRILEHMIATRLATFLLLANLAIAQDSSPTKSEDSGAPKLPVIEYDACPGADTRSVAPARKIENDESLYSSWGDKRTVLGTLRAGEKVTLLAGVNVIREPDKAVVTQRREDDPALNPGDRALGYGLNSNGEWNFWIKGAWHKVDSEEVAYKGRCGFGDESLCYVAVMENGVKEWWIEVRTNSGLAGWVLVGKTTHDAFWHSNTFGDLCMLD